MNRRLGTTTIALLAAAHFGAAATPATAQQSTDQRPSTGPQQSDSQRPMRVLLLGDHSLDSHFRGVGKALKNTAEVTRSALGHLSTGAARARLDELLGDQPWDLVCFNFGLSDLMCRDPRSRSIRAMSPAAGGVPVTPLERYSAELEALLPRLRARSKALLWVHTLPLSPRQQSSALEPARIALYNAAAAAVMRDHAVPIVDTHAHVEGLLAKAENQRARNRLHNEVQKRDLSEPVVNAIRREFGLSGPEPAADGARDQRPEPDRIRREPRRR